jgi:hypothetical protein
MYTHGGIMDKKCGKPPTMHVATQYMLLMELKYTSNAANISTRQFRILHNTVLTETQKIANTM